MYTFCWILFLMVFGGRVSGSKDTDNTGNYDYNDIYYPDGYQNLHDNLQRASFDFRQPIRRQLALAGNLPLVAALGGVSTLHYRMDV